MKLLFDENLSPRLPELLSDVYPDSAHVHDCELGSADDLAIWRYAKDNGFAIVSEVGFSGTKRTSRLSAQNHLASRH